MGLTCEVTGFPRPKVSWTSNGSLELWTYPTDRLIYVYNTTNDVAGEYTCTAGNVFGYDSQTFTVKVLRK